MKRLAFRSLCAWLILALVIALSCVKCEAQTAACDSILKYKTPTGCIRISISQDLFVKLWVDSKTLDTIHNNLVVLEQENDSIRAKEEEVRRELRAAKEAQAEAMKAQIKKESFVQHSLDACKQYNSDMTASNEKLSVQVGKLKQQRKGDFLIGGGIGVAVATAFFYLLGAALH